jgi:hypothetical protein
MMRAVVRLGTLLSLVLAISSPALAQARRPGSPQAIASGGRLLEIAGFVHVGSMTLAAERSFEAILGSSSGTVVGGGGEVVFRRGTLRGLFGRVDVSRFEETGERVFVFNGEVFPLDIPTTITLTPVEFSAGYRYVINRARRPGETGPRPFPLVPYAGLGVGSMSYRETSSFATSGDDVDERFTSYHAFGGVDVRIWKGLSAGVEGVYRWVPDALDDGSGVSEAFNESNLDGATVRARVRAAW